MRMMHFYNWQKVAEGWAVVWVACYLNGIITKEVVHGAGPRSMVANQPICSRQARLPPLLRKEKSQKVKITTSYGSECGLAIA